MTKAIQKFLLIALCATAPMPTVHAADKLARLRKLPGTGFIGYVQGLRDGALVFAGLATFALVLKKLFYPVDDYAIDAASSLSKLEQSSPTSSGKDQVSPVSNSSSSSSPTTHSPVSSSSVSSSPKTPASMEELTRLRAENIGLRTSLARAHGKYAKLNERVGRMRDNFKPWAANYHSQLNDPKGRGLPTPPLHPDNPLPPIVRNAAAQP